MPILVKCQRCGNDFKTFLCLNRKYCSRKCYFDPVRFWKYAITSNNDGECWGWSRSHDKDGYGVFHWKAEQRAHRVAWRLTYGDIPEGFCVLHHCDNPGCVNPKHLFLGTNADNMADKTKKGRNNTPTGERAGGAKLKAEDVLKIRALHAAGECQRVIAKPFTVGFKAINKIVLRQRWKHI